MIVSKALDLVIRHLSIFITIPVSRLHLEALLDLPAALSCVSLLEKHPSPVCVGIAENFGSFSVRRHFPPLSDL